jgi:D-sedoheptulose 7-phosphate isomerase
MRNEIEAQIRESIAVKEELLRTQVDTVAKIAELLIGCLRGGGKVLLCGNGGSAADAQHLAGELVGRFRRERRALPAIALSVNTSVLTAIGNDYGFDRVFSRQVEALASRGDVLIGISTSGNSANVLAAFDAAHAVGCRTVAFTGGDGGKMKRAADLALVVPSSKTWRIQESHITVGHIVCDLVESAFAEG